MVDNQSAAGEKQVSLRQSHQSRCGRDYPGASGASNIESVVRRTWRAIVHTPATINTRDGTCERPDKILQEIQAGIVPVTHLAYHFRFPGYAFSQLRRRRNMLLLHA